MSKKQQQKQQAKLNITAHSGIFHGDEVFATAALSLFVAGKGGYAIKRTRDKEEIEKAKKDGGVVIDVGGEYDPARRLYDHHQRGYRGPMSSFGMIWKHEIKGRISDAAHNFIQRNLVGAVDAQDNGVAAYKLNAPHVGIMTPSNLISTFNDGKRSEEENFTAAVEFARCLLTSLVRMAEGRVPVTRRGAGLVMNEAASTVLGVMPQCDLEATINLAMDGEEDAEQAALRRVRDAFSGFSAREAGEEVYELEDAFAEECYQVMSLNEVLCCLPLPEALTFAEGLIRRVHRRATEFVAARQKVQEAMASSSGGVLELNGFIPWKEHLHELDPERQIERVVFEGKGGWMCVARPDAPNSFGQPLPLPEGWAGLTDEALSTESGIEGMVFCHLKRFLCVAETREAAMKAAEKSLMMARSTASK